MLIQITVQNHTNTQ